MFHKNRKNKNSILVAGIVSLLVLTVTATTQNQMAYALTFGSTKNISQTGATDSISPFLELSGNNVYTAYVEEESSDSTKLFFRSSTDAGNTFRSKINLANSDHSNIPSMAKSGSNVYVAWGSGSSDDIFFRQSSDNGATFGTLATIGKGSSPKIAASGNNVYLVWEKFEEVFFRASTDNGKTFGSTITLENDLGGPATIAASGNNVYIAWLDDDSKDDAADVYFKSSVNNGKTFRNRVLLDYAQASNSMMPILTASGNSVYVAWSEITYSSGSIDNAEVYFRKSINAGASFSSAKNLSNNIGISFASDMQVSGNSVYVVWRDATSGSGNYQVLLAKSSNSGDTFSGAKTLSPSNIISENAQISLSGNAVHIIWQGRTASTNNNDIYFISSGDGASTFGSIKNLSNNIGDSTNARIQSSTAGIFVIWEDHTTAKSEILIKKGN